MEYFMTLLEVAKEVAAGRSDLRGLSPRSRSPPARLPRSSERCPGRTFTQRRGRGWEAPGDGRVHRNPSAGRRTTPRRTRKGRLGPLRAGRLSGGHERQRGWEAEAKRMETPYSRTSEIL